MPDSRLLGPRRKDNSALKTLANAQRREKNYLQHTHLTSI